MSIETAPCPYTGSLFDDSDGRPHRSPERLVCLSLTQPWASLLVAGKKKIETRGWATSCRGVLYIQASKGFPMADRALCDREPFRSALKSIGVLRDTYLPTGSIVGRVTLVRCERMTEHNLPAEGSDERAFGLYEPGRVSWHVTEPVAFPEPIPCKGALSVWTIPADVAAQIVAVERQISLTGSGEANH